MFVYVCKRETLENHVKSKTLTPAGKSNECLIQQPTCEMKTVITFGIKITLTDSVILSLQVLTAQFINCVWV